eukprot:6651891-Prymnesium_polylepis.1
MQRVGAPLSRVHAPAAGRSHADSHALPTGTHVWCGTHGESSPPSSSPFLARAQPPPKEFDIMSYTDECKALSQFAKDVE